MGEGVVVLNVECTIERIRVHLGETLQATWLQG